MSLNTLNQFCLGFQGINYSCQYFTPTVTFGRKGCRFASKTSTFCNLFKSPKVQHCSGRNNYLEVFSVHFYVIKKPACCSFPYFSLSFSPKFMAWSETKSSGPKNTSPILDSLSSRSSSLEFQKIFNP